MPVVPALDPAREASVAEWLFDRLEWPVGRRRPPQSRLRRATYVAQVIPVGFAAYARVLHPARRVADGACVRWTGVAAAHAEMQWHAVPPDERA